MKNLVFYLFLLVFSYTNAQYTDIINSNKPGFSESPYSVGIGVYQFESELFFKKTNTLLPSSVPQSFGLDVVFRTGVLLEKLELSSQFAFQEDKVFDGLATSHSFTSGLSKFNIGAKYLIHHQNYSSKSVNIRSKKSKNNFDKKRLIPSVSVYLGLNTDFVNNIYKKNSITLKTGLCYSKTYLIILLLLVIFILII